MTILKNCIESVGDAFLSYITNEHFIAEEHFSQNIWDLSKHSLVDSAILIGSLSAAYGLPSSVLQLGFPATLAFVGSIAANVVGMSIAEWTNISGVHERLSEEVRGPLSRGVALLGGGLALGAAYLMSQDSRETKADKCSCHSTIQKTDKPVASLFDQSAEDVLANSKQSAVIYGAPVLAMK